MSNTFGSLSRTQSIRAGSGIPRPRSGDGLARSQTVRERPATPKAGRGRHVRVISLYLYGPNNELLCDGFIDEKNFSAAVDQVILSLGLNPTEPPSFQFTLLDPPEGLSVEWHRVRVYLDEAYDRLKQMVQAALDKLPPAKRPDGLSIKLDEAMELAMW